MYSVLYLEPPLKGQPSTTAIFHVVVNVNSVEVESFVTKKCRRSSMKINISQRPTREPVNLFRPWVISIRALLPSIIGGCLAPSD